MAKAASLNKRFTEYNNGPHVCYNAWYTYWPSSAKQQRELPHLRRLENVGDEPCVAYLVFDSEKQLNDFRVYRDS